MNTGLYTVKQLARLAGVSVRTLHHYDDMGLLKPTSRSPGGYRLYGESELLRLQQILLYRETGIPLIEIARLLDDPSFDRIQALERHREVLLRETERMWRLAATVEKTLKTLKGETTMTDEELYDGIPAETAARWQTEARQMFSAETMEESQRRLRRLTNGEWQKIRQEGEDVAAGLAPLMVQRADSAQAQKAIARHHAWIENFYTCGPERYRGLADLYVDHDEFRAYYDRFAPGLAVYMRECMLVFADGMLPDAGGVSASIHRCPEAG